MTEKTAFEAAEEVLAQLQGSIDRTMAVQAGVVSEMVSMIEAAGEDAVSDFFFEASDSAKSHYAKMAANLVEDADAQEEAIGRVEEWIADNIANAGWEANAAYLIMSRGLEQAMEDLRQEIGAPSPAA